MNPTTIGYLRVSTGDQTLGLEAQRESIERWAARQGVQVTAWHVDRGVSGATPLEKRPALLEALAAISRGSVLVVAKRDRLARDTLVAAMVTRLVERKGAELVSADGVGAGTGPEGALMTAIVDAFAQYERALIRTRTSLALQAKKARGERAGQIPIGYRLNKATGKLVEHPAEQQALRFARVMKAGGHSFRTIAEAMNREGYPARGREWYPTTVRRALVGF